MLGEPDARTVFYFTLIATLVSGIAIMSDTVHPVTWKNIWLLTGLGCCATLAQLAMTRAYRVGRTLVVGSLAYITIIFASLFGMAIWHETLTPAAWLGMAFIIASGVSSLAFSPKH